MTTTQPHNRVALVTGASRGIGRACAHALIADGWRVGFVGRDPAALQTAIADAGDPFGDIADRALALSADVGDPAAVGAAFDALIARFGRLDLLFNNAGISTPATAVEDLSFEQWQQAVAANLTGPFLCTQRAFRIMKSQNPRGGRIINNGSISAHTPRPQAVPYSTTKHAITGLTRSCALDGRPFDIAVGQIDIGNVATDMTARMVKGVLQPDGSLKPEARMAMDNVTRSFLTMANLPLDANVLFMTVMATQMPYVGRG